MYETEIEIALYVLAVIIITALVVYVRIGS